MSDISNDARTLFNAIPVEGKISGAKAMEATGLGTPAYKAAKTELKKLKYIELGKGRGGTINRVEGVELPDAPKKKSKEEILEEAREVKAEKSRAQKKLDETKASVLAAAERLHPDAEKLVLGLSDGSWYVEVWNNNAGKVHFVPEYEWSDE